MDICTCVYMSVYTFYPDHLNLSLSLKTADNEYPVLNVFICVVLQVELVICSAASKTKIYGYMIINHNDILTFIEFILHLNIY